MDSLVSTEWLAQHLGETDLVVVDSSWFMPASGRSGRQEYLESHIPGARFLDIDEISDNLVKFSIGTRDQGAYSEGIFDRYSGRGKGNGVRQRHG